MQEHLLENLNEAAPVLKAFIGDVEPVAGLILGSGLNSFADKLHDARVLPFGQVVHMKVSTAVGHRGCFVLGRTGEDDDAPWVLCMQGRIHAYEGADAHDVAFPVWLMARCGITTLITTNAAGAINQSYKVGDFCIMSDHINFTGRNPLVGVQPDKLATRFVPMLDCFDPELRELTKRKAQELDVPMQEGVYMGVLGPSFETPAEIRAFARLGADTVAMSVCEEVIAARHMGMRVLGMSLISNMACGIEGANPSDEEVHIVAATRDLDFARLMAAIVAEL